MGHGALGHGAWGMGHGAWGMGHGDGDEDKDKNSVRCSFCRKILIRLFLNEAFTLI